jgi:hypothetical protein
VANTNSAVNDPSSSSAALCLSIFETAPEYGADFAGLFDFFAVAVEGAPVRRKL